MLTEKDYCDYNTCVALKELGYDGYCAAYYHLFDDDEDARNSFEHIYAFDFQNSNNIYRVGAPLLYQAQKWLREEKNIIVEANFNLMYKGQPRFSWRVLYNLTQHKGAYYTFDSVKSKEDYDSFKEALSEGIKEAIEILKEENND